jgi:hypothetical protein
MPEESLAQARPTQATPIQAASANVAGVIARLEYWGLHDCAELVRHSPCATALRKRTLGFETLS